MDTSGNIFRIEDTQEAVKKAQEEMTILNDYQAQLLEQIAVHQRHEVLRQMKSKNHNAKRRANKKIAKASRQRNRR